MADSRLEKFRQMMRQEEEKKGGNRNSSGDNASYPFWNIPEGSTATVRFTPDKDENNPWGFYVERQVIRLPFDAGVVGGEFPTDKPVSVTVPCVDMFGMTCPIIAETRPWWRDDDKKELARRYYKKRSFISQGFVVSSPFEEPNAPENPLRRFVLGSELLAKIKAGMADPDMEYMPTDYENGCDFRICKTVRKSEGREFNNYGTSSWSRRTRALSENELIALERYGLFNLADFLGPRPTADELEGIKAMFHASLDGEPFDMDTFGKYSWKPYGSGSGNGTANTFNTTFTSSGSDDELVDFATGAPVAAKTVDAAKDNEQPAEQPKAKAQAADIIAKLRAKTSS